MSDAGARVNELVDVMSSGEAPQPGPGVADVEAFERDMARLRGDYPTGGFYPRLQAAEQELAEIGAELDKICATAPAVVQAMPRVERVRLLAAGLVLLGRKHGDAEARVSELERERELVATKAAEEADQRAARWEQLAEQRLDRAESSSRALLDMWRWVYALNLAAAKLALKLRNAEQREAGEEENWPAQSEWSGLVSTSHSIFLREARDLAGIDHAEFLAYARGERGAQFGYIAEEEYERAALRVPATGPSEPSEGVRPSIRWVQAKLRGEAVEDIDLLDPFVREEVEAIQNLLDAARGKLTFPADDEPFEYDAPVPATGETTTPEPGQ